jgi:hypothetical protein
MSLKAIVDDYIRRFRPSANAELEWFRGQATLEAALDTAAKAIDDDGKRYSHQCRITSEAIVRAGRLMAANVERIRAASNFGVLLRRINEILGNAAGLGELYIYDTALRLGAKLGFLPQQVFLHAGTRVGAAALGLDTSQRFLFVRDMPEELRVLAPHEIEDVLCIYAEAFEQALSGTFVPPDFVWCYPEADDDREDT